MAGCAPPEGILKINVDAAFNVDEGRGSIGVFVRDSRGKFVAASCLCIPFVPDAMTAEAFCSEKRDGPCQTTWS